jgi:hypothetical protein
VFIFNKIRTIEDKVLYINEPKIENKEKDMEFKLEKNIFSMKDEVFEEFKNYKNIHRPTIIKINNTNIKNQRNENSRLKSMEKTLYNKNIDSVNNKFFRASSSSFKFYQVKNKLSESSLIKNNISDKKSYNLSVIDRINKKK